PAGPCPEGRRQRGPHRRSRPLCAKEEEWTSLVSSSHQYLPRLLHRKRFHPSLPWARSSPGSDTAIGGRVRTPKSAGSAFAAPASCASPPSGEVNVNSTPSSSVVTTGTNG